MRIIVEHNVEFVHYGVLGMKWGVRRYQNPDGTLTSTGKMHYNKGVLKKGTTVRRIALDSEDKTYDNKKYVSLTDSDNEKWKKYLTEGYGKDMQNITYKLNSDIKIASAAEQGKIFVNHFLKDEQKFKQVVNDTAYINAGKNWLNENLTPEKIAGMNVAFQSKTGKEFVEALKKSGYGAMEDAHGRNVADNPIAIFDPDKNLTKISSKSTKEIDPKKKIKSH